MANLRTGTRVKIKQGADVLYGTIVETPPNVLPRGKSLVCMDLADGKFHEYSELVGPGHGFVVSQSKIGTMASRGSSAKYGATLYKGIPKHIGVCVNAPFTCDGVTFELGAVGRVLSISNNSAYVRFLNVPKLMDVPKFIVPLENLRWCSMAPDSKTILYIFHTSMPTKSGTGDIMVYQGDTPCIVAGMDSNYVVTKGVLLRHKGSDSDRGNITAEIVSGMAPEALGMTIKVHRNSVRKFETPFISRGSPVEIVAEVTFKKKSLLGATGTVVLATDFEGDIGVQFPEDIGAGSLDGAGKEGQCLYIPALSVRQISE